MDATPYAWFSGDRGMCALHGAIDDATGQVTGLYMTKNECLHGYFETLRRTIENFGIPVSAYADRHTIFQSPNAKRHEIDASIPMNDTQFGRALKELGTTLIAARSPQAKGRVERLWGTLQDRLRVEFGIHGVKTVDEANAFLETYIYDFNARFAVEPENAQNAFRKPCENENIDHILCVKEKRAIDAGGVFSYGNKSFSGKAPRGIAAALLA
jgi:transposase InsO family protein